jgi:hypothetical protein
MVTLKVSQKSLTKYSTLYRWNGYFGHLSEVIKIPKYQFWTFWTDSSQPYGVNIVKSGLTYESSKSRSLLRTFQMLK